MTPFKTQLSIRWADIDPNFHMRHSVYYDCAAQMRTEVMAQMGITMKAMQAGHFGPVLFREECAFFREISFGDNIFLTAKVSRLRKDYTRFSIQHEFVKEDGTVCAVITVDGGWINTKTNQLTVPPRIAKSVVRAIPKTDDFCWDEVK